MGLSDDRHKGLVCPIIAERTGDIAVELLKNPVTPQANAAPGLSGKGRESVGNDSGCLPGHTLDNDFRDR